MDDLMNLTAQEMRNRSTLETGMLMADKFINRNYLIRLSGYRVLPLDMQYQSTGSIRLFKIEKIVYDKKENVNDKLISVYSALQDVDSSALMILEGTPTGTSMYVGVRSEINAATAGKILEKSFQGNFCGSELKSMVNSEIDQLMKKMVSSPAAGTCKNVSCVTVVPSPRDEDKDKFVQGLEKFADTMQGEIYTALFIATPVSKPNLEMRKRGLEELYSSLTPFLKTSLAYGTNSSESVARGRYTNFADSVNNSISNTTGKNRGQTETSTQGKNSGFGFHGFSSGSSSSYSSGYSTGESWTRAVTTGNSHSTGGGDNETETQTTGDSKTITIEHQNKAVQALTEKIDKQMARISECESFGVWECACYFIAEDIQTSVVAANSYKALVSGENTGVENSFVNVWGIQNIFQTNQILEYMRYGIHPLVEVPGEGNFKSQIVSAANLVSGKELPFIMGILVMKLSEYRAANASGQNLGLRHVTVMEEAHNLLKKSSGSGGNGGADLIGKSVEMISNSIAEMRTYGEGFLIVDQSPTAVDISAIKNTNTKIIMRLPEQKDCKAVGRSVSLNEDQILELSRLGTGIAVIMQNNWLEAVRGRIYPARRQYEKQAVLVPEDGIRTLRGKLIMELLNQYTARSFDENRLLALLKGAPVPEDKAGEYGRSAREIASVMTKRRDSRQFSDSLMSLAGCRNLFDILENELGSIDFSNVTEDDEIQIFVWHKLFLKKLDHYLTMNPGKKKLLSQYLIYSRLLEDGTSKYIIIYNTLFH